MNERTSERAGDKKRTEIYEQPRIPAANTTTTVFILSIHPSHFLLPRLILPFFVPSKRPLFQFAQHMMAYLFTRVLLCMVECVRHKHKARTRPELTPFPNILFFLLVVLRLLQDWKCVNPGDAREPGDALLWISELQRPRPSHKELGVVPPVLPLHQGHPRHLPQPSAFRRVGPSHPALWSWACQHGASGTVPKQPKDSCR